MQLVHCSCIGGEVQHQGQHILSGLSVVLSKCTHKKKDSQMYWSGYNGSTLLSKMIYMVQKYIIIENKSVLGDYVSLHTIIEYCIFFGGDT